MPRLKPLKLVLAGVDKISAPVTRISRRIDKMQKPIRQVTARLRTLDRVSGFKRLRAAALGVGRQLANLTRTAALLGTALVAAGGAAIKNFVDATDEIAKTADFAGIGVEALQEYRFAFDRAGVSQEKTDKGLIKLGKTIGELRAGSGTLFTILQKTNTEFLTQLVNADNATEAFDLLITKLAETENTMDRAALANAAFGRTGQLMANAVKDGLEPFDQMRKRARELGFVLDEETVRKGEITKDVFTDIGAVFKGLALSIGGDLLPEILETSQAFLKWSLVNREVIKKDFLDGLNKLVDGIKTTASVVRDLLPRIEKTAEVLGGMAGVIKIVAAVIATKLVISVLALAAAFLLTPLGLVIAGVTILGLAANQLRKSWEPLKLWFEEFWSSLKRGISGFADALPDFIKTRLGFDTAAPPGVAATAGTALGARAPGAAAALAPGGAGGNLSGRLEVSIAQDRAPRVERAESTAGNLELDVSTGLTLAPGAGF